MTTSPPLLTDSQMVELVNLWHLSATSCALGKDNKLHARMCWSANEFSKLHPEVPSLRAYKALDRELAWKYNGVKPRRGK